MTPAQRRALEAVRDGRVVLDNARPPSGRSWRYVGARTDVVEALVLKGLASDGPWLDSFRCRVVLTDAGWYALDEGQEAA